MDPIPISVRQWTPADLEEVRRVTWETWVDTYSPFIPLKDLRTYFDEHYSIPALRTLYESAFVKGFMAEAGKETAGYVRTQFNSEENRLYVSSLYILPAFQGRGAGTKLMAAAEECARAYGLHEVWLGVMVQNARTVDWYRRMGFRFDQEAPFTMGETTVQHYIGCRQITQ